MPRAGSLAVDFLKATSLYEQGPYGNKSTANRQKKSGSLGSEVKKESAAPFNPLANGGRTFLWTGCRESLGKPLFHLPNCGQNG
jgi:hypothetical protein